MLFQHFSVSKPGANHSRVNARSNQILTGCPHLPKLRMLTDDIAVSACDGFFGQCGSYENNAGARRHVIHQLAIQGIHCENIDSEDAHDRLGLAGLRTVFQHQ